MRLRTSQRSQTGSLLLEVCVAMLLLAVALIPLIDVCTRLSTRRTHLDDRVQNTVLSDRRSSGSLAAWSWGPRPGRTAWLPGPSLELDLTELGCEAASDVGVWLDGWFLGESATAGRDSLVLGSVAIWQAAGGQEVVVRAREEDGGWGVPLRTVVPGDAGAAASAASWVTSPGAPWVDSSVVAHLPALGSEDAVLTTAAGPVDLSGETPLEVGSVVPGPSELECSGTSQSWVAEPGRDLDVYF